MSRARSLVLTAGPVVIIAASAAGAWLTSSRPAPLPRNEVWAHPDDVSRQRTRAGGSSLRMACDRAATQLAELLIDAPYERDQWSIAPSPPFVVAGLMEPEAVDRWVSETINPAANALWASYFRNRPDAPITVLLLPDEESYRDCADWMFGDVDISGFGYFRPEERTLVANIGTGGGTLVHELTHALMAVDFPNIPDWLNEGLASLHEQCKFRPDGSGIDGLVNWRLPDLQEAQRRGELRSVGAMITSNDFRGPAEGLNYAQARYFCLYLQRLGVLERFYMTFRDRGDADLTGNEALRQVFPNTPLTEVDADFRRWMLQLRWSETIR